jgi:hypothetical protein
MRKISLEIVSTKISHQPGLPVVLVLTVFLIFIVCDTDKIRQLERLAKELPEPLTDDMGKIFVAASSCVYLQNADSFRAHLKVHRSL